jgi:hypothetical protein
VADSGASPKVIAQLECDLAEKRAARAVARMYLPGAAYTPAGPHRWTPDQLTWWPDLQGGDDIASGMLPPAIGQVVVIGPVDPGRNPTGKSWIVGRCSSREIVLDGTRIAVQLTLADPEFTPSSGFDLLNWSSPVLTGRTWADVDPAITWDDLRITRGTTS